MIATVISATPSEHKAIVLAEQLLKGNQLNLQDIEEAMNQYWQQCGTTDKHYDVGLSAFSRECYKCQSMDTRQAIAKQNQT